MTLVRGLLFLVCLGVFGACSPSTRTVVAPVDPDLTAAVDTASTVATSAGDRPPAFDLARPLPVDSSIIVGTLENGLSYYIRANARPENRAELRLGVNAGSVLEDEDQLGLAHFLEHMAFNGTERFEKQELVDYLESIGMRFGPDLNAYTSFDETVYMLQVRTDSADQFETGFEVLREWAGRIALDPEEIDRERGVVIEEWRLGRGAQARVRDEQLPVLLNGSRYAERLPIGDVDVLRTAPPEALRRFYESWYRPDLMAVVAVGDFDPTRVESLIREHFSTLTRPGDAPRRPSFGIDDNREPLVSVVGDPELPYGSVQIIYKHDKRPEGTVGAYRRGLVETLHNLMFNDRLDELTQSTDPPFAAAFAGSGSFVRNADFYQLSAIVTDGRYRRAAEVLLTEAERVARHGFTAAELDRAKTNLLRGYERAYNERDKSESSSYAAEYLRNYFEHEPIPGIALEYAIARAFVPDVALQEINRLISTRITDENRVILVDGPDGDGRTLPQGAEFLALFDEVDDRTIEPYVEDVSDAPLLPAEPAPGRIVERSVDEEIGVTRLTLSNGIRLVLKPTDFKNDEVVFSATSPGGTSLYPDSLYVPASYASTLIGRSGIGTFGPIELEKKLAGKVAQVRPVISSRSEGFSGSASPEDLETLFQLIHLYVTAPRADSVAYVSFKKSIGEYMLNLKNDPDAAFRDTIMVTMAQNHPRAQPFSEETLEAMDLQRSLEIFEERFADLGDFRFYFVGAFDVDELAELAVRYLGSLPAGEGGEQARDIPILPPEGQFQKIVRRGVEPKAQVRVLYTGPGSWSMDERRLLSIMTGAFQIKLREVLREDLGGTYGVGVGGSLQKEPVERYSVSISFGCDPERVDELLASVFSQIDSLRQHGLDETYLAKVRESSIRAQEVSLKRNGYWLSTLDFFDENDLDPSTIPTGLSAFLASLEPDDLQEAARRYFDEENRATFVLLPDTDAAAED